ncbi:hypothetical protein NLJ89_g7087 [Agrocybe chaxingu]|uniref:Uncharacterized protein n=1 Tax=Agrocybe chaxingu TaxID=84603 RepID=A0A9W8MU11_9AGAR|nr:hypothetical protein NLJ89_g7087 [Agrocybe chaxingu]
MAPATLDLELITPLEIVLANEYKAYEPGMAGLSPKSGSGNDCGGCRSDYKRDSGEDEMEKTSDRARRLQLESNHANREDDAAVSIIPGNRGRRFQGAVRSIEASWIGYRLLFATSAARSTDSKATSWAWAWAVGLYLRLLAGAASADLFLRMFFDINLKD